MTHVQVAELAGVGRATVYRHWPRSDLLLAEAMATVPMPFFTSPTTPIRQWIRTELTALARELELHDVRAVATTLANTALWDPSMDARRAQFAQLLTDRLAAGLDEAHARGELTMSVDSLSAAAVMIGPLYYRSTIEHGCIDDPLIDTVIAALGHWTDRPDPGLTRDQDPHDHRERGTVNARRKRSRAGTESPDAKASRPTTPS